MKCRISRSELVANANGLNYLQEELEGLSASYPDHFKVYYVLNQVPYLLMLRVF